MAKAETDLVARVVPAGPPGPVLVPEVTVVIHPIDVGVHPTIPAGYRWAVMVGGVAPSNLDYCAGAGHAADESTAAVEGESHGSTVCKALRLMGAPARYGVLRLGYDPIPAEADHRPLGVWRGEEE
jgi:hypothetical protein